MMRIKNIVIIILIVIAIFQTGELWFESTSNRNFFYSFFYQTPQLVTLEEQNLLTPSSTVINFGNKTFKVVYKADNDFRQNIENIIKQALMEANSVQVDNLDWNELLVSKSIIYQYNYMMQIDTLAKTLKARSTATVNRTLDFDAILVTPMLNSVNNIKITFVNSKQKKINQYEIKNSTRSHSVYEAIEKLQQNVSDPIYISTEQAKFDLFTENIFVPQFTENTSAYIQLKLDNEIYHSQQSLEMIVDPFFDNPTSKWSELDMHGVYMFSDQTIVVKYYKTNIIEYSNYSNTLEKSIPEISASFAAAQQILRKDASLVNNINLTDIIPIDDGFVFCYNYNIDNIPIVISNELSKEIGMKHAIEITTVNNTVRRYKRYIRSFQLDSSQYRPIQIDFLTALNNILANGENIEQVQNIMLIYNLESRSDSSLSASLNWLIKIDGEKYTLSAVE